MKTDGRGITTLVALAGCPLACPYCINGELLKDSSRLKQVTAIFSIPEVGLLLVVGNRFCSQRQSWNLPKYALRNGTSISRHP